MSFPRCLSVFATERCSLSSVQLPSSELLPELWSQEHVANDSAKAKHRMNNFKKKALGT